MDTSRADIWIAVGTFAGPLVAVLVGLLVFRIQQQSQDASQRFVTDGVQALYGALSTLLSIHLLNFQIGNYTIRMLKVYRLGDPLTPEPNEVTRFLGLEIQSLPIGSLLPVRELIGDRVVQDWVVQVLSDITLEAKECEFQIRQPVAAYYRSDPSTTRLDVDEAVPRLAAILDGWNDRISCHFALLERINDLAAHLAIKRPWTIGGYFAVSRRTEVALIRDEMRRGYESALAAKRSAEPVLRTGGTKS